MFFALAFFDFFMPGFNTERANSATMHTSIAPTVAVENGSNAKANNNNNAQNPLRHQPTMLGEAS